MSTSLTSLTTNYFPSAQNGFSTTLASTIASGAATVPLNSVAGYTNGQIAVFVVDPSDASKKQTFTGVIDTGGIQVTSVVWTAGTNQQHTGGSTVVDYATATHISMMTKGLLAAGITQAGGMGAITPTSVTTSGAVLTTPKVITSINDTNANEEIRVTATASAVNDITVANAATGNAPSITASGDDSNVSLNLVPKGTGELQIAGVGISGAWTAFTPTITSGAGTLTTTSATGRYKQIGKTVHFKADITITTVGTGSGACLFTLPVTAQTTAGYIGSGREDGVSGKQLQVKLNSSTTQGAASNYDGTSPLASGSVIRVSGTYEAA